MSRNRTLSSRCCLLLALIAGCDSAQPDAERSVARDSAGVTIVENRGPRWEQGEAWQLSSSPELVIGEVFTDNPAFEFSRVNGLTRLSNGGIVVLDGQTSQLRFFDAGGRHLFTRGGRGGGPGEFSYASRMMRLSGDTLLIEDSPLVTVLYSSDGQFLQRNAIDILRLRELGPWGECQRLTLPDRSFLGCRPEPGHPRPGPDPGPGLLRIFSRFVRVTPGLDSIRPLGLDGGLEQWGVSVSGRTHFVMHPFHSTTAVATGGTPLRIAIATNPDYSVEMWRPDGTLDRVVRRIGADRTPTQAERAAARESLMGGDDEALANRIVAEVPEPTVLPAVAALLIDEASHLWAVRWMLPSDSSIAAEVFEPDGEYLGEMRLPHRFRPIEIGRDYVLGVFRDENNVSIVQLYGLER